jgi:hypothetical protein
MTTMTANLWSPRWFHGGQQIAFVGPNTTKQGNNLYILDTRTLAIQKLTARLTSTTHPLGYPMTVA